MGSKGCSETSVRTYQSSPSTMAGQGSADLCSSSNYVDTNRNFSEYRIGKDLEGRSRDLI